MKSNLIPNLLLTVTIATLVAASSYAIALHPPGNLPWSHFFNEPAAWSEKLLFLVKSYVWPGLLAYVAILLLQLQFRLASSGMNGRIIFVMCVAASAAMISGFATMAAHRGSEPLYVAGMALANTTMSRLYAMRLRTFFGRVQIPWPIWRGDREAVEHVNRRMQQMSCAPHQR